MAGWGLVKQGYTASKVDAVLKLEYDLYYIKHQSLWLDLVILLKTFVDTFTLDSEVVSRRMAQRSRGAPQNRRVGWSHVSSAVRAGVGQGP